MADYVVTGDANLPNAVVQGLVEQVTRAGGAVTGWTPVGYYYSGQTVSDANLGDATVIDTLVALGAIEPA
jgi:hypothetical protein